MAGPAQATKKLKLVQGPCMIHTKFGAYRTNRFEVIQFFCKFQYKIALQRIDVVRKVGRKAAERVARVNGGLEV